MRKFCYILMIVTAHAQTLSAQENMKDNLIGTWRLEGASDKQISMVDKQKRYTFTSDTIHYTSSKLQFSGPYRHNEKDSAFQWDIPIQPYKMHFKYSFNTNDTLFIDDTLNHAIGVLVRIPNQAIANYNQAVQFEKDKQFNSAVTALLKAVAQQHPDAIFKLGMYYMVGIGVSIDVKKGSQYIRQAATLGHAEAYSIVISNSLPH